MAFYASFTNWYYVYLLNFCFKYSDEDVEMDDTDEKIVDPEPIKTTEEKIETQTEKTPEVTLKVVICSLLIFHWFLMD